jgi:predicted transcriptional regulator
VWPFVYKLFKDREIVADLGETRSVASSMAKNSKRRLESVTPRGRKVIGSKTDIVFAADKVELGACEVGKGDVSIVDDKYLNDGLRKLPKTLRDMLVAQTSINVQ